MAFDESEMGLEEYAKHASVKVSNRKECIF